ncbi:MAG TPA: DNA gyrase inhibitor YacG [Tepidisphaeraceae bacterium]|nr:DNA gyrase inhibitor YacG [Tepidisphaeraceae bacterium]
MRCPICKSPVSEAAAGLPGSTFPFCSERCKLIDLGRWIDGKYQVPVVEVDETDVIGPIDPPDEPPRRRK